MKDWKVLLAGVITALACAGLFLYSYMDAVVRGETRAVYRNARYVNQSIVDFQREHGRYPVANTLELFAVQVKPEAAEVARSWECRYQSDGSTYELRFPSPFTPKEPFVFRDGQLIAYPRCLDTYLASQR